MSNKPKLIIVVEWQVTNTGETVAGREAVERRGTEAQVLHNGDFPDDLEIVFEKLRGASGLLGETRPFEDK